MLLLVDAGNTRVKWALAADAPGKGIDAGDWVTHGAVLHAELERLPAAWLGQGITRAIVSNVAGAAMRAELEALLVALLPDLAPEWFVAVPELAGLRNGYRNPGQLGSDRFAAALGARTLAPGQALVVATCGTATTVDAVSADGVFIGGMILPGVGLMLGALARGTAQLPQVATGDLPAVFADNTQDAILSGCLSAQAGAIERACAAHGAALCIVSGGAAGHVAPLLSVPYRLLDNIVLVGLHAAASVMGNPPC
ncbi:type III pantothenate kinase [Herbaspirillum sp. SJZ107]|uniref:type III pantothenate kinase n=1 Tax=Herbaspirillum sp. SJZ107 TaxID=2572881 RepID=UPI00114E2D65|nr:type III pantothenate kinase [Herbaspirillum sp. SJZ107]TQK02877.1 type III pantothenate kinase [Herbaspirillum sp. SJZ107]